jgi:hypothetical protein
MIRRQDTTQLWIEESPELVLDGSWLRQTLEADGEFEVQNCPAEFSKVVGNF